MAESDDSWEDESIEEIIGDASEDDDNSSDVSVEGDDDGDDDAIEVRGAEPYRFEPVVDRVADDRAAAAAAAAGDEDLDRLRTTNWCTCGRCVLQPLVENSRCCKEIEKMREKMQSLDMDIEDHHSCLSEHEWFVACCLHPATLQTAHLQYQTQYGRRAVQGTIDQKYRHVAYRQVVRWCWGYLGRHNRVPLPSCVMDTIKETYPNPDGQYKGFQYPPLDLD